MSWSSLRVRTSAAFTVTLALLALSTALTAPVSHSAPVPRSVPAAASPASGQWGAHGATMTDSAVTVRWDNTGNHGAQIVPRDATQRLFHTKDNKSTYDDIDPSIRSGYNTSFHNLAMTVTQTRNLVGQAIQLTLTGVPVSQNTYKNIVQVMQCSGLVGPDGTPDSAHQGPDPQRCVFGAGGLGALWDVREGRNPSDDPLAVGGDWARPNTYPHATTKYLTAPFIAADGTTAKPSAAHGDSQNEFYNQATTNEVSNFRFNSQGEATLPFRVDSSLEQPALGCGVRAGQPSAQRCWVVVVPRRDPSTYGDRAADRPMPPVAPSLWAQRMQVELNFRPLGGFCPSDGDRVVTAGSELLVSAMASWLPSVCDVAKLSAAYSKQGDLEARSKQAAGAQPVILTSAPSPGAIHAPIAIAAPVIAYNIDTENDKREFAGALPQLRFTPRLVAKLLTQSYRSGMSSIANDLYGWASAVRDTPWLENYEPRSLSRDPEFTALNPQAPYYLPAPGSSLVLENLRTDSAAAIWAWILADPHAASFLSGCPDDNGYTINPFYSTRAYTGCAANATTLESAAQKLRAATLTPPTWVDSPMVYPGDAAPFPQLGWMQAIPKEKDVYGKVLGPLAGVNPLTMGDAFPRLADSTAVGTDVFTGLFRQNNVWCLHQFDSSCTDGRPETLGVWKSRSTPPGLGGRFVMGVTDAATAARLQLPTAQLCTSTDINTCVGANTTTLSAATTTWKAPPTAKDAPQQTGAVTAGAYPLTVPVYAAITPATMSTTERTTLATVLTQITTTGQKPGTASGELPPGYAPLSAAMIARTQAVATALHPTPPSKKTPPNTKTTPGGHTPSGQGPGGQGPGGQGPGGQGPGAHTNTAPGGLPDNPNTTTGPGTNANTDPAPGTPALAANQQHTTQGTPHGKTPLSAGWFSGGLIALLGAGIASAVAAPILERRGLRTSKPTP